MKAGIIIAFIILCVSVTSRVTAETEFARQLKENYEILSQDLLNNMGEKADISDFTYKKDVATFTFKQGTIHLLRYVNGRPTTAIFIGQGNVRIAIPSHVEKQSLASIANDSIVDEDFETCFIRMGDDFDLSLRERFTFESKELSWKNFNLGAKKSQGEIFFKPTIYHTYDNLFQLLRSVYKRDPDGYFWIDFNRYVFTFDPSLPEQVLVAYEYEGGDVVATKGAVFQRQERNRYDDAQMSDIAYPTTVIDRQADIEMTGYDGKNLSLAETAIKIRVNADSLRFVSLFLHNNLKTDSIYYNGAPVDYIRRKDFRFIGIVLPHYRFRDDTLDFTLWYGGKQFDHAMPWVANPQVSTHSYSLTTPKDYNYFMPDMGKVEKLDDRRQTFPVHPQQPYNAFYYECFTGGVDTIQVISDAGISLNFLEWELMTKKVSDCFIPHDTYREITTKAYNFMLSRFGASPGTFEVYVSPVSNFTMPGVMNVPQIVCATEGAMQAFGGFHAVAGREAARQWFGSLMRPASDREQWILEAVPEYVNIMFIQDVLGSAAYSNLLNRRDSVYRFVENEWDLPLAIGSRAHSAIRANKGLWVLHMLRFLMYDIENSSDRAFLTMLRELQQFSCMKNFTNTDFIGLAEKHYGQPLDWFFRHWLYGINYPEYEVEYTITSRADGYYVEVNVKTKGVGSDFKMPVIFRVVSDDKAPVIIRQTISNPNDNFEFGPFANKPSELVFGEFYSVLCKSEVEQK
ncbi:MAG: hypothetical protein U9R56_07790 [candidate division Zixibacteria bacterium]|nr:hypothetical protein [candidate division Zixibacteria bacterium]